jgi:hypothetical protein
LVPGGDRFLSAEIAAQPKISADQLRNLDQHDSVFHAHLERLDGQVGGEGERPTGAYVEPGAVPGTDGDALLGIEVAFGERPVVVGTTVFDGEVLAFQVIDADRELARPHDLHLAGRELLDRADG